MAIATIEIEAYEFSRHGKSFKGFKAGRWIAEQRWGSAWIIKRWSDNVGEVHVHGFDPMGKGAVDITESRAIEIILGNAAKDALNPVNA